MRYRWILSIAALLVGVSVWAQDPPAAKKEQPVELEADRKPTLKTNGNVFIKGGTIITVTGGVIENGGLLVQNGKITAIGKDVKPPADIPTIDATGKFVTPGIIDAHSHMASDSTNEGTDSITAEVRIRDVLNPQSISLFRALSNGVTSALVLHGSANSIGGQSLVIKTKWNRPEDELPVPDAPRMIKFALGENVKRSGSPRPGSTATPRFPATRLGVEAVYRHAFLEARAYMAAWDKYEKARTANPNAVPPRRDLRLETLADILKRNIWVHCHSYRADEMLMMLRLSQEFGFKLAALQHALEAYKIAPEIKAAGVGVSTFADEWAYKVEAGDAIPYNAALCLRAGIVTSVNSDNGSGTFRLNAEAAKAMKFGGLSEAEAWKLITINSAIQLGIDKRTGSLEAGKDGDITIWEGHPFSAYTKCVTTLIEGEVFFQRRDAFGLDKLAAAQKTLPVHPDEVTPLLPAGGNGTTVYALVGATIHPVSGPDIPNGTLVLANGVIQSVGAKLPIPKGAVVVQARGLHIYPGMIDGYSSLGLTEIDSIEEGQDTSEIGSFQPDLLALTAVNPSSEHFGVTRCEGITATLTHPSGGVIAGQSAVINLSGWTPDLMKVGGPVALHINFPEGTRGFGQFRAFLTPEILQQAQDAQRSQMDGIKEYFEKAKRYAATRAASPGSLPVDPAMEAMVPYVTGKRPVIFNVSSAVGIRKALEFADAEGLKPIISGGRDAWKVSDLLAQKKVPVIYRLPKSNSITSAAPSAEYDPYDTVWAAPALLQKAGVKVCFGSNDAPLAKNLPTQVGIACAYGLSREDALKALTLQAAEILGVGDKMGSLEPGKIANVIVTDGDPMEFTTRLHGLFISGKPVPLESRHTRLYQTYRQRLPQQTAPVTAARAAKK